ncbi:SET domain-containing protein 9 [Podila horticola]|nr:SET domain-containing protein 9 [Podila horticola]
MKLMLKRLGIQTAKTAPQTLLPIDIQNSARIPAFDPIHTQQALTSFFGALKRSRETSGATMQQIMKAQFGFWLEKHPSLIPNAGDGVFLRGGRADPGAIVAMYPGTLYRPGEAIFFNSLHNRYILKCNDGIYVDGKANGLSGSIYRSLNSRDNYPGITPTADTTWMTSQPKNPLAIGQIVNNGASQFPPNVRYQELDITTEACSLELQQFLPNIWYSGDWHDESQNTQSYLRTVVLVTTRTVEQDQELYSTYIEN